MRVRCGAGNEELSNPGRVGKVKSRKQAIAIGLSEARKKGAKVPKKKSVRQAPTTKNGFLRKDCSRLISGQYHHVADASSALRLHACCFVSSGHNWKQYHKI